MAWNDVKSSTNKAVHLLVTIGSSNGVGGREFNFKHATDLKVERKIGDTMSKFSLGIIDDGKSDNYIEFERYLLNKFVNIEIAYGNTYTDLQYFTGFVVDYQPVFLGNTTKLTVTGYLTKIRGNTNKEKLTSPYSYWYDWTPYVGVRYDVYKDWDNIYGDGGLKFNEDMKKAATDLGADFTTITEDTDSEAVVSEDILKSINDAIMSEQKAYNKNTSTLKSGLTQWFEHNYNDWTMRPNGVLDTRFNKIEIDNESNTLTVYFDGFNGGTSGSVSFNLIEFMVQHNSAEEYVGSSYDSYLSAARDYNKKRSLLLSLAKKDAVAKQEAEGAFKGAIPFHPDIMKKFDGNTRFTDLEHEQTHRILSRVSPDLFIPWDKEVPLTALSNTNIKLDKLSDEEYEKYTTEFSRHVICDIKVFGLRYRVNHSKLANRDAEGAYSLYERDRWGVRRVFKANNQYYIWVGDIPELWKKFQKSEDFSYQAIATNYNFSDNDDSDIEKKEPRTFDAEETYHKGEYVEHRNELAEVLRDFTTDKNPAYNFGKDLLNLVTMGWYDMGLDKGIDTLWERAKNEKAIRLDSDDYTYSEEEKIDYDIRDYYIFALRENDEKIGWVDGGTKDRGDVVKGHDYNGKEVTMSREYRIKTYLQSAFRSALPLGYGQVRISDIVKQLAYLEKWDDNEITATTASSYNSPFLCMNGQSALEYISETLGPNATEAGGGRVGFTTYFENNKLIFRPASMHYSGGTVFETGYGRKDSDVISFTVRTRGVVLMSGVDDDISNLNAYTNENMTASTKQKQDIEMSGIEAKLRQELSLSNYTSVSESYSTFFNLPLYYYYGNSTNNIEEFASFVTNVSINGSIAKIPFASQTTIRTNSSSATNSQQVIQKALYDLDSIRKTCIQAEMTIMGNTSITPGQWITINNYTKRGPHYTSGDYFVQSISDQVVAGSGFTQNLTLYRFSDTVSAMSLGNTHLEKGISILRQYGNQKFESWILKNYPDEAVDWGITAESIQNGSQNNQSTKPTDSAQNDKPTGNEGKPYYKRINGVEFWGESKVHDAGTGWSTFFYPDSGTYEMLNDKSEVIAVGKISDYKNPGDSTLTG